MHAFHVTVPTRSAAVEALLPAADRSQEIRYSLSDDTTVRQTVKTIRRFSVVASLRGRRRTPWKRVARVTTAESNLPYGERDHVYLAVVPALSVTLNPEIRRSSRG